jgi:hypothetical protein
MEWLDVDIVRQFLGDALGSQVAQWTMGLAIASVIHSSRVKKEIKAQFGELTGAIKELGAALRQDLNSQSERIGNVEKTVSQLSITVDEMKRQH